MLRDRLGVRCLLGLTATATMSTALDIAHHLGINDQEGIAVRSAAVPHNLQLSVSMDRDKDEVHTLLHPPQAVHFNHDEIGELKNFSKGI